MMSLCDYRSGKGGSLANAGLINIVFCLSLWAVLGISSSPDLGTNFGTNILSRLDS